MNNLNFEDVIQPLAMACVVLFIGFLVSVLIAINKPVHDPDPGHYCVGGERVYFLGRVSDGQGYIIFSGQGRTAYIPLDQMKECEA